MEVIRNACIKMNGEFLCSAECACMFFVLVLLFFVVVFSRPECVGRVSGCHAEQTQTHRQPQHLDHAGNERA